MKYPVGTQYLTRGKAPHVCTIVDYIISTNLAGEIVNRRYVATHEFCGQVVTDYDVPEIAISRGFIKE